MKTTYIVLFAAALLIAAATALLVTPLVRRLALHVGMLDASDDRRMHADPKPRIGGLGVFVGFSFALFARVGFALKATPLFHKPGDIHNFFGLLFGSTLILMVGVWDDVMGMSSRSKLLAQIVVALLSMLYGFVIPGFDIEFTHSYVNLPLWLGLPLTLVWYLGMMNAINFLDGLDGLLSGVTAISGAFLFAIALWPRQHRRRLDSVLAGGRGAWFSALQLLPGEDHSGGHGVALHRLRVCDRLGDDDQ